MSMKTRVPEPGPIPAPVVPGKILDLGFEKLLAAAEKAYRQGYREGWKSGWRAGLAQYIQPKTRRKAAARPRKKRRAAGAASRAGAG